MHHKVSIAVAEESRERWNWQYNKINFKKTFVLFWIFLSVYILGLNAPYQSSHSLNYSLKFYWLTSKFFFESLDSPKLLPQGISRKHGGRCRCSEWEWWFLYLFCAKIKYNHYKEVQRLALKAWFLLLIHTKCHKELDAQEAKMNKSFLFLH